MDKVILVCLDNFQDYIINNIKQLTLLKYEIIVIISDNLVSYFDKIGNIKLVKTNELDDYGYDINSSLDRNFRGGFWRLASQRLFYLYSYIKKENITNCFHIENDVMIYSAINISDKTKIWLIMDSEDRCIPSIIFIPTCEILGLLISNYIYDKKFIHNSMYGYICTVHIGRIGPIYTSCLNAYRHALNDPLEDSASSQVLEGSWW